MYPNFFDMNENVDKAIKKLEIKRDLTSDERKVIVKTVTELLEAYNNAYG